MDNKDKKENMDIEKVEKEEKKGVSLKKVTYILLSVLLALLIGFFAYLYTLYNKLDDLEYTGVMNTDPNVVTYTPEATDDVEGLPEIDPATPTPEVTAAPEITPTPGPTETPGGITNILIIGHDSKKLGAYNNARSDVNMILTIDEVNNEIKLSSYMRDILVYYDDLKNTEGEMGRYDRLNVALQFYDHPDGVIKTLENNFVVEIDYYMMTDYWGVEKLINILGGVRVYLTDAETHALNDVLAAYNRSMNDGRPIDQYFVSHGSGARTLNGRQAVSFMRIRKIDSDFGRINRQHEVLESLKAKISEMDILDIIQILDKMPSSIYTDIPQEEMLKYTKLLYSMKELELQHITIPVSGTWENANYNGMSIITIDFDANNEILVDFVYK